MGSELEILTGYLKENNLRLTKQRKQILGVFLSGKAHPSAENLYESASKINPGIGRPTVFRTVKLFCEAGLAKQVRLEDGRNRYEHEYGRAHHDHIVCIGCGKSTEAFDERIEKLQAGMCRKIGFVPVSHRLEIYGYCEPCAGDRGKKNPAGRKKCGRGGRGSARGGRMR